MANKADISVLRELLRHVEGWRSAYESDGVDVLPCPDGTEWSLWDLEYLIEHGLPILPRRQRQSIILCLICGYREVDAAIMMGVSPTNPVAMYATDGINSLLDMIDAGRFARFRRDKLIVS